MFAAVPIKNGKLQPSSDMGLIRRERREKNEGRTVRLIQTIGDGACSFAFVGLADNTGAKRLGGGYHQKISRRNHDLAAAVCRPLPSDDAMFAAERIQPPAE